MELAAKLGAGTETLVTLDMDAIFAVGAAWFVARDRVRLGGRLESLTVRTFEVWERVLCSCPLTPVFIISLAMAATESAGHVGAVASMDIVQEYIKGPLGVSSSRLGIVLTKEYPRL